MIGIYDCFGYGTGYEVSFEERYKLIKNAGFDCVMLWWSDKFGRGIGYQKDVRFARNFIAKRSSSDTSFIEFFREHKEKSNASSEDVNII